MQCPYCKSSDHVVEVNTGEQVGMAVGAGSALGGIIGKSLWSRFGTGLLAAVGIATTPAVTVTAIITATTASALAGKALGREYDKVQQSYHCEQCNQRFRRRAK